MDDSDLDRDIDRAFPARSDRWHQLDKDRKTIEEMIHEREIVFFPLAEPKKEKSYQEEMEEFYRWENLMKNKPILQKEITRLKARVEVIKLLMKKELI